MTLSITENELIQFFGNSHTSREYGSEWFDSDSVYEVEKENIKVTFGIHPIHADVRLCLYEKEKKIYDFQGLDLQEIELTKDGRELKLIIEENETILLRVEPDIIVEHINKKKNNI